MNNGFEVLNFEDYSFFEQVYLMKHCKILAGVHGQVANIAFMPENSSLFELIRYTRLIKRNVQATGDFAALSINITFNIVTQEYGNYICGLV